MPLVATADVIDTGGIGAGAGVVVMGADAGIAAGVGRMRAIAAITSAAAARTAAINAVQENRARRGTNLLWKGPTGQRIHGCPTPSSPPCCGFIYPA